MRRVICFGLAVVVLGGCVFAGQGAGGSMRLPRVFCLKGAWLAEAKGRIGAGDKSLRPALDKLIGEVDEALEAGPFSVMDKTYGKLIGKLPAGKVAAHRIRLKTAEVVLGVK